MLSTFYFAIIFGVTSLTIIVDGACTDCPGCSPISVGASSSTAYYTTCNDPSATPTITSVDVADADGDGDGFTITLMDKTNYDKYHNGQGYQSYDISGTGPGERYTCFHSGTISYQASAVSVYAVIDCKNILETCNLRYKVDITCHTCPIGCSAHGSCVNGVCRCDSGYSGTACDQQSCGGVYCDQGKCSNGQCVCDNGYTGTACSIKHTGRLVPGSITVTVSDGGDNSAGLYIGLMSGGIALFVIIVAVVGIALYKRQSRRRAAAAGEVELVSHEVLPAGTSTQ